MLHEFQNNSDAELVERIKAGDKIAETELYHRYYKAALNFAFGRFAPDVAEDCVQDAWIRACDKLEQYDDSKPFRPWFFTIVKRVGINMIRKLRPQSSLDPDSMDRYDPSLTPEEAELLAEKKAALLKCMAELEPQQHYIIKGQYFREEALETIAAELVINYATVRSHASRAKVQLRNCLAKKGFRLDP